MHRLGKKEHPTEGRRKASVKEEKVKSASDCGKKEGIS
jgi:hypothetical protein